MNITALWIISFLFKPTAKNLFWVFCFLSLSVGIGLLFSTLHSYVGLSGVLHGIFAFYALSEALGGRKSSWLLVVGIIAKVSYEQCYGASESTVQLIAAQVAIEAHLIGAFTGLLLALTVVTINKIKSK